MLRIVISLLCLISCSKGEDKCLGRLPEYYTETGYLESRIDAIKKGCTDSDNCDAFIWITDMHWESNLNARQAPALIRELASRLGINMLLNGGDTANNAKNCAEAISSLRDAMQSDNVLSVSGNHEIGDASRYERPFNRVDSILRGHNKNIVYGDDNRSFFYYDDEPRHTRYIGLATYGLYTNGSYESLYDEKQLIWFQKEALDVKDDWTIIIFAHALYYVDSKTNKLGVITEDAKAFINAIDEYNGAGKIACVLIGHSHIDRIHIGASGVPYILSQCDRYSPYYEDINIRRTQGTISEQHFEVVVVDKNEKIIKLFAIGSNSRDGYDDQLGEETDLRTINYN